jgi:hypothetical protein
MKTKVAHEAQPLLMSWLPLPATCENWTSSFLFLNKPKKEKVLQNADEPALHPIHYALEFQKMLDEELVNSRSELAKKYGMSRARVTQIMRLLELPAEIREYLLTLDSRKQVRRLSERRLRPLLRTESPKAVAKAFWRIVGQATTAGLIKSY